MQIVWHRLRNRQSRCDWTRRAIGCQTFRGNVSGLARVDVRQGGPAPLSNDYYANIFAYRHQSIFSLSRIMFNESICATLIEKCRDRAVPRCSFKRLRRFNCVPRVASETTTETYATHPSIVAFARIETARTTTPAQVVSGRGRRSMVSQASATSWMSFSRGMTRDCRRARRMTPFSRNSPKSRQREPMAPAPRSMMNS